MDINWTLVFYAVFLIDSIGAIIISWFGDVWWKRFIGPLAKYFPAAKGWAILYFVLVLVIGHLLGFF